MAGDLCKRRECQPRRRRTRSSRQRFCRKKW